MATWWTTCTATSTPSCSAAQTSAAHPAPSSTATPCLSGSLCLGTAGRLGPESVGSPEEHLLTPPCPGQEVEARVGRAAPRASLQPGPLGHPRGGHGNSSGDDGSCHLLIVGVRQACAEHSADVTPFDLSPNTHHCLSITGEHLGPS